MQPLNPRYRTLVARARRVIAAIWLGGMLTLAAGMAYLAYVYLWPGAASAPDSELETTIPTRLIIPNLAVEASIVPVGWETVRDGLDTVTRWQSPGSNVGFAINSAPPLDGTGNTVLIGHNNILGEIFRELDQLKPGDRIVVFSGELQHTYQVSEVLLLQQLNASDEELVTHTEYLAPTATPRLTLVSCWPYEVNTYRVIVIAEPLT